MKKPLILIALSSFLILYLELILIRYLPAYIYYLGYFSNFIFMASLLGMGLGVMLAGYNRNLIHWVMPFLLILIVGVKFLYLGIDIKDNEVILFKAPDAGQIVLPTYTALPLIFMVITAIFICLSQVLGKLFLQSRKPLAAYIFDLMGAILGIALFRLGSYWAIHPTFWFLQFGLLFLILYALVTKSVKVWQQLPVVLILILVVAINLEGFETIWSPYYKLTLIPNPQSRAIDLYANGIGHQYFSLLSDAGVYSLIYSKIGSLGRGLDDVLIIGSGTGQDVAAALSFGAKHIDAVEIDPVILEIGKRKHPEKPYADARVTSYVDDGRHFLETSQKKYDFIILALTDSVIANSRLGQVRLESYLFTREAFERARSKLKKGGFFITYNNYRQEWLVERLKTMMVGSFGKLYSEIDFGDKNRVLIAKNDLMNAHQQVKEIEPHDDWPFLYVKERKIPLTYLNTLGIILLLSLFCIWLVAKRVALEPKVRYSRLMLFFFLGVSFALLETKSIAQMTLIFGWTWIVNALVFGGILLTVLLAALIALRFQISRTRLLFVFLALALFIQYLLPPAKFLMVEEAYARFILSVIYFFSPIFLANLIFAKFFKESKVAPIELGSNLLGLVVGSILEYSAIAIGFANLTIMAAIFYFAAFLAMISLSREKISSSLSSINHILHR